jgi:hypothetical protein
VSTSSGVAAELVHGDAGGGLRFLRRHVRLHVDGGQVGAAIREHVQGAAAQRVRERGMGDDENRVH